MKTKTIAFMFLAVLLALTIFAPPVYAQAIPALPHAFYGAVKINGSPAPAGTQVEARGEGVLTGVGNNPIVVIQEGKYGSPNPLEPKLVVQGNVADGTALTFYVNGVPTGQTAVWHSGEVTELNVTATIEGTPPETTEAPPPAPPAPEPAPEPASPAPPAPPASPSAPAEPGNWPVLWGVIGGVILVGIIIFLVARRKAY